jgi:hypothetical protein
VAVAVGVPVAVWVLVGAAVAGDALVAGAVAVLSGLMGALLRPIWEARGQGEGATQPEPIVTPVITHWLDTVLSKEDVQQEPSPDL